jgi:hypothetical protein
MKSITFLFLAALLLAACSTEKKKPNVSGIKLSLDVQRFEQDLFASDTNNIAGAVSALAAKYPGFFNDFMGNILGIPPGDPQAGLIVKKFITDFRPVKEAADARFRDFTHVGNEVTQMLKYTRHYFPEYPLPAKLITFVGPMDAFYESSLGWSGDVITSSGLAVGLQMHLGAGSPMYAEEGGKGYPQYISRRFEPSYIVVNCARNIIDDMYPDQSRNKTLVEQMVDKGKRMYVLDHLLPDVPDTLKIGYTANQLAGAYKSEAAIWNMFTINNFLFESDYQKLKSFVGEGPKTPELGDESPGYIALFTGWQIVKKYMNDHPNTSLDEMLKMENRKLFELSKYKPKN